MLINLKEIYLRMYRSLAANATFAQSTRVGWCDLIDALRHLHSFGIVHADVRVDNILSDDQDSPLLCDFSAASPCGQPDWASPDLPLLINGPSPTLSEAIHLVCLIIWLFCCLALLP